MNSIHEAIRKFRPDLKLEGWTAPERPLPAAAAYPEFIKPEMVARGLAGSNPLPTPTPPAPQAAGRRPAWQPFVSLALVFALAITVGAGLALRPARVGRVEARTAPEHHPVAARQNTAKLVQPLLQNAPLPAAPAPAAPAVAAPTVAAARPQAENTNGSATVRLTAVPRHALAPLRNPPQYVSLQPVSSAAPVSTATSATLAAAAPIALAAASTPMTIAAAVPPAAPPAAKPIPPPPPGAVSVAAVSMASPAAVPNTHPNVPEILYEADSPQAVPASTGEAPAPAAAVPTKPAGQAAAHAPAANDRRIQGIFWDKQRPLALLGDDIIEVGSTTPLGKVVAIEKNYVVFEKEGGKRVTLAP